MDGAAERAAASDEEASAARGGPTRRALAVMEGAGPEATARFTSLMVEIAEAEAWVDEEDATSETLDFMLSRARKLLVGLRREAREKEKEMPAARGRCEKASHELALARKSLKEAQTRLGEVRRQCAREAKRRAAKRAEMHQMRESYKAIKETVAAGGVPPNHPLLAKLANMVRLPWLHFA